MTEKVPGHKGSASDLLEPWERVASLVVFFALIGPSVSYSNVYAFHLVAILWLILLAGSWLAAPWKRVKFPNEIILLYLLISLILITGIWSVDLATYARHALYLMVGLGVILATYFSSKRNIRSGTIGLSILIPVISLVLLGVLETLGLLRYPIASDSAFRAMFWYSDAGGYREAAGDWMGVRLSFPTVFYGNRNDLAFVLVLIIPFVILLMRGWSRVLVLCGIFWVLIVIGSRAQFLSLAILLPALLVVSRGRRELMYLLAALGAMVAAAGYVLMGGDVSAPGARRMLSSFQQIGVGVQLIVSGEAVVGASTETRAAIYTVGLTEYSRTLGMGLGLGGGQAALEALGFTITSFHFFFLQLFIELGPVFLIVFGVYLFMALDLIRRGRQVFDMKVGKVSLACGIALLISIPGSIGPSGLYYFLPFYVLLGFSLASWSVISRLNRYN